MKVQLTVLDDHVEQTTIPVEYHENVVDQSEGSENIWPVCVSLSAIHEGPKLVDLDESVDSQQRVEPKCQVEDVER